MFHFLHLQFLACFIFTDVICVAVSRKSRPSLKHVISEVFIFLSELYGMGTNSKATRIANRVIRLYPAVE
jgi:hypothetical protein